MSEVWGQLGGEVFPVVAFLPQSLLFCGLCWTLVKLSAAEAEGHFSDSAIRQLGPKEKQENWCGMGEKGGAQTRN